MYRCVDVALTVEAFAASSSSRVRARVQWAADKMKTNGQSNGRPPRR